VAVQGELAAVREVRQIIHRLEVAAAQVMEEQNLWAVEGEGEVVEAMQPIPAVQVMLAQMQTQQLLTA
jgi:hypothetical protein